MQLCEHEFISSRGRDKRDSVGIRQKGQQKLSLNLRQLRFEAEMKTMPFPKDLQAAIKYQLSLRAETLENKYKQVFAFTLLKRFGSFWEDFGCKSMDEWLAVVDLPSGATLANREVMVRMFSKETFVLIGDDMLGEMMYLISRMQSDTEKRKKDYQNIFTHYCKSYTSFDKTKFREILNWYVNTTYTIPSGRNVEDTKARPPMMSVVGTTHAKVAKPVKHANLAVESQDEDSPRDTVDFVIEERLCAGCRARDKYIAKLEGMIAARLGEEQLPTKPRAIKAEAA